MSTPFEIREARASEAATLSRLMSTSFLAAYGDVAPPDRLARHIASHHDAAVVRTRLTAQEIRVLVACPAEAPGTLAGYIQLGVRPGAVPELVGDPSAIELERCYLAPAWIGSGAATTLMTAAQRQAHELGRPVLYLSVYQLAPRAVRFYERHGFVRRAAIEYRIDDIRYDDWLMVWQGAA